MAQKTAYANTLAGEEEPRERHFGELPRKIYRPTGLGAFLTWPFLLVQLLSARNLLAAGVFSSSQDDDSADPGGQHDATSPDESGGGPQSVAAGAEEAAGEESSASPPAIAGLQNSPLATIDQAPDDKSALAAERQFAHANSAAGGGDGGSNRGDGRDGGSGDSCHPLACEGLPSWCDAGSAASSAGAVLPSSVPGMPWPEVVTGSVAIPAVDQESPFAAGMIGFEGPTVSIASDAAPGVLSDAPVDSTSLAGASAPLIATPAPDETALEVPAPAAVSADLGVEGGSPAGVAISVNVAIGETSLVTAAVAIDVEESLSLVDQALSSVVHGTAGVAAAVAAATGLEGSAELTRVLDNLTGGLDALLAAPTAVASAVDLVASGVGETLSPLPEAVGIAIPTDLGALLDSELTSGLEPSSVVAALTDIGLQDTFAPGPQVLSTLTSTTVLTETTAAIAAAPAAVGNIVGGSPIEPALSTLSQAAPVVDDVVAGVVAAADPFSILQSSGDLSSGSELKFETPSSNPVVQANDIFAAGQYTNYGVTLQDAATADAIDTTADLVAQVAADLTAPASDAPVLELPLAVEEIGVRLISI
jgi:hypothetical protein